MRHAHLASADHDSDGIGDNQISVVVTDDDSFVLNLNASFNLRGNTATD